LELKFVTRACDRVDSTCTPTVHRMIRVTWLSRPAVVVDAGQPGVADSLHWIPRHKIVAPPGDCSVLRSQSPDPRIKHVDLRIKDVDLRIKQVDLRIKHADLRIKQVDLRIKHVDLWIYQTC
jgi:hypothetical protein